MVTFTQAVRGQETRTTNGMKALVGSSDSLVDLFSKIGASRGQDIIPQFIAAYNQDRALALRIALWARDIRGGAGERQIYRDILAWLEKNDADAAMALANKTPLVGRWDDLHNFTEKALRDHVFGMIRDALREGNGLAAKWTPRKGEFARQLREFLEWSPKRYRKTLVTLSNVVEQQMCSKEWSKINYNHVPSVASKKYRKAFWKNDKERFEAYVNAVSKGEKFEGQVAKVNASAIFPHDVIRGHVYSFSHNRKNESAAELQAMINQWDALPNYIGDGNIMPLVDVSGSMCTAVDKSGLMAIEVAVSLGLYCADKNKGKFNGTFLTFSGTPELINLQGNIKQKIDQMVRSNWAMNTNLHAAFNKMLSVAKSAGVPAEEMPKTLLILSDMQFDQCVSFDDSAIQMIRRKYEEAGYEFPSVVFWNINAHSNVPVKFNERGVALVSGFSPSILKSVLSADMEQFTPRGMLLKTVMIPRYDL